MEILKDVRQYETPKIIPVYDNSTFQYLGELEKKIYRLTNWSNPQDFDNIFKKCVNCSNELRDALYDGFGGISDRVMDAFKEVPDTAYCNWD